MCAYPLFSSQRLERILHQKPRKLKMHMRTHHYDTTKFCWPHICAGDIVRQKKIATIWSLIRRQYYRIYDASFLAFFILVRRPNDEGQD